MKVSYNIASGGWCGAGQYFAPPQNWAGYNQFSFRFNGSNTGTVIRLELLDDRAPDSRDTSERFEYLFTDNFSGWKTFTLSWTDFTRRTDWQPPGAPNNGLTLSHIWGYDFSPLSGSGSFQVDQLQLLKPATAPTSTRSPSPTSLTLDNFDSGSLSAWNIFNGPDSTFNISLASPGWVGQYAMQMDASIAANGWGGVGKYFSAPQNWSPYNNMDFWVYGNNTSSLIRLEILDNRQPGSSGDTSERFEVRFADNWSGWKHFVLPWSNFTRRLDWQPASAPNDGFTNSEIWGFNFSVISGTASLRIDDISLTTP
jgi:hypothetical protein